MKHPTFVAIALVIASGAAVAQDTTWTGWHVGGQLGYANMKSSWKDVEAAFSPYSTWTGKKSGLLYGANLGYDWQINHAVIGAELDYSFGSVKKSADRLAPNFTEIDKLQSLMTLRARAGYAFDKLLLYGTAGLGQPTIHHEWVVNTGPASTWDFKNAKVRAVYGAGLQYRFTDRVSMKGEYLVFANSKKSDTNAANTTLRVKDKLSVFQVGVNYHFGAPKAAVEPPPPPPPVVEEVQVVAPPPPPPPPPPAPVVKPVVVAPPPPPQKIVLDQAVLHFANSRNELSPEGVEAVQQVARELQTYPGDYALVVSGHTSSTGSKAYNKALSKRRADAVANVLVDSGIPAASIETVGMGPDQPIMDNATAEGQARNRRVEIEVKVKDAAVETRTIQTQTQDTPAPRKKVIKKK